MVTLAAHDRLERPARMARFWAPLLGYVPQPPPDGFDSWVAYYQSVGPEEDLGGDPDDYIDPLVDPSGEGPRIWFQPVPETKTGKTRFHFDHFVADRSAPMEEIVATVDAKVAELVELGATIDHPARTDTDTLQRYSVVMHDPEGTSSARREAGPNFANGHPRGRATGRRASSRL